MQKPLLVLISILIIFSCQEKNSNEETERKPVFESIKIERYTVENANPDSTSLSSYIIKEFDIDGTETKSIYYSSDDSVMMQFANQYDNGNKTKVNWINGKDELVKYVKMTYNDQNQIVRSESFNPADEFQSGFIHQWKDNGLIEEKGPIEAGKAFKPNSIYNYNDQGEFVSLVEYDENDSLYGTFKWKYINFDDNKEWTERQMMFNDTLVRIEKRNIKYVQK